MNKKEMKERIKVLEDDLLYISEVLCDIYTPSLAKDKKIRKWAKEVDGIINEVIKKSEEHL